MGATGEDRPLEAVREALRQTEQFLAIEVEAARRLEHVATRLISVQGTRALFDQILDTAQSLVHADAATIQMFYPDRGTGGELLLPRSSWVQRGSRPALGMGESVDKNDLW